MGLLPLQRADAEATRTTDVAAALELERARRFLRERADVVALVLITAVAAIVRFSTLGAQGLDHDEAVTAAGVLHPTLPATLSAVASLERTPPLFYILEWLWTQAPGVGTDPANLRFLSAVFGTLTVPVAYLAAREMSSRRAGVLAAALVALNPFLVWYSQEARAYSLLVLMVALGLYLFVRALRDPTGRRLVLWAGVSVLALCTHYFAVFVIVPEAAWLLWSIRPRRRPLAAVAGVGVAGAALVPLAVGQQSSDQANWFAAVPVLARAWQIPVHFASTVKPEIPSPAAWITQMQIGAGILLAALVLAGVALVLKRGAAAGRRAALMAFGLAAASFAIPLVLAASGLDFVDARNVIATLVVLLIGSGIVFGAARPAILGTLATAVACAMFAVLLVVSASTKVMQRPDWRVDAASIGSSSTKRLVVVPRTAEPPLSYFLGAQREEGVGRPVWVRQIELFSRAPTNDGPRAPFKLTSEHSVRHGMWVTRYRSPHPVRVWLSPDRATHMISAGAGALVTTASVPG